jgi:uncharacterized protein (TIGR02001 family)
MHFKSKILASTACLAAIIASPAFADTSLTANAQFTTDYVLRGITQTATRPAVQGGLDFDTGIGITAGTWVSSLDFGDNTPLEWDLYAAYNFNLGPVSASLGGIGYIYPSAGHFGPYNYFEFTSTLGHDFGVLAWSAKAYYSPFTMPLGFLDIRGVHPETEYFLSTGLSVPFMPYVAISGNIGYEGYTGAGTTDYTEWDLGVTVTYDKYAFDLRYIDTSKHAGTAITNAGAFFNTGPFVVGTFTFKFP